MIRKEIQAYVNFDYILISLIEYFANIFFVLYYHSKIKWKK